MLIDVHCHLNELADAGRALIKAKKNNVQLVLTNSVDLASMQQNLKLASQFNEVECCLGLHPSNALRLQAKTIEKTMGYLRQNLGSALAVGETGLDFKHAAEAKQQELQIDLFKQHLRLAQDSNKAVQVHSRRGSKQVLEFIEDYNVKVLLHWFVAKSSIVKRALDLGCLISVGPGLLFSEELHNFARKLPLESMLLETDCPVPFQGKPSQPAWIKDIAAKVAEIKELGLAEIEAQTTANARRLFNLKI